MDNAQVEKISKNGIAKYQRIRKLPEEQRMKKLREFSFLESSAILESLMAELEAKEQLASGKENLIRAISDKQERQNVYDDMVKLYSEVLTISEELDVLDVVSEERAKIIRDTLDKLDQIVNESMKKALERDIAQLKSWGITIDDEEKIDEFDNKLDEMLEDFNQKRNVDFLEFTREDFHQRFPKDVDEFISQDDERLLNKIGEFEADGFVFVDDKKEQERLDESETENGNFNS